MKTLILFLLLFCIGGFNYKENQKSPIQLNEQIKGKWTNEQAQIQYIVDSHLVHEKMVTTEKGKVYHFDETKVQVKYPDGTTAQGSYTIVNEDGNKKVVIQLPGTTTAYNLIAVTRSSMVWQKDLDDVYYNEGATRKSAERAIYTEEFKK